MIIPDHYFACGATHQRKPFESTHGQTIQKYSENVQAVIERGFTSHGRIVVVHVTTLFATYRDLPAGAWNHEVVDRVMLTTRRRVRARLRRMKSGRCRSNKPGLQLAWGRFHREDGRPGYQQHWLIDLNDFILLGDERTSSYRTLVNYVEQAWECQEAIGAENQGRVRMTAHDRFYLSRPTSESSLRSRRYPNDHDFAFLRLSEGAEQNLRIPGRI